MEEAHFTCYLIFISAAALFNITEIGHSLLSQIDRETVGLLASIFSFL